MIFALEPEVIQLGSINTVSQLLSSELRPELVPEDSVLRQFRFPAPLAELVSVTWDAEFIFILLPEVPLAEMKQADFHNIIRSFPELRGRSNVYLFPYGSSAAQLALRQANRLLSKGAESIQLVALHQDPRFSISSDDRKADSAAESSIASECFIVAKLIPAKRGLRLAWSSYEMQTQDKSAETPITALLHRYRVQQGKPLSQCYFPSACPEEVQAAWLNSVGQLQTCIDQRSEMVFADARIGDLGPCSGLFNLCHLQASYKQHKKEGTSLILDISAGKYRSVAMFQWVA
jgi:hypothetical protein